METYYSLLVLVNEYARINDEDQMVVAIDTLNERLRPYQMEVVRDDEHSCYTIGITEYISTAR